MLFANKAVGGSHGRSKTPQRSIPSGNSTSRTPRKEANKYESGQREKATGKEQPGIKYKTKDSFQILQCLENIYHDLSFNDYDVFPL